ncbi:MAG: copper resistance protein NlpE [Prevotellaceae bacterium]|jgi:uncharacterized lipoprotein NlpE involved in copper resistance|nr:copper resistance protein NlpE [Prevotellaceae bacterium]
MKKYFIVLLAASLSFAIASCGSGNKNKTQDFTENQTTTHAVRANGALPSNINDLLENYMGTYEGVVPCADCSGIDTKLTLNSDYTYSMTATYQGKGDGNVFKRTGKWKINESLDVVTLDFDKPQDLTKYKIVDNNTLQMLDKEGKEITSSHNYFLTK